MIYNEKCTTLTRHIDNTAHDELHTIVTGLRWTNFLGKKPSRPFRWP